MLIGLFYVDRERRYDEGGPLVTVGTQLVVNKFKL